MASDLVRDETGRVMTREKMIGSYMGLAEGIARKFIGSGEPYEDLAQEAYAGLVKAADDFDSGAGVKFSTYATHKISGQVRHYLRDKGTLIRRPGWLHERSRKIDRVGGELEQVLGREPTNEEIALQIDLKTEDVDDVRKRKGVFYPESTNVIHEDGESADDKIIELSENPFEGLDDNVVWREYVDRLSERLTDRQMRVFNMVYVDELSQTEAAEREGISQNYVSHMLRECKRSLEQMIRNDPLKQASRRMKSEKMTARDAFALVEATLLVPILLKQQESYLFLR